MVILPYSVNDPYFVLLRAIFNMACDAKAMDGHSLSGMSDLSQP